jgi:hypothetical protein
MTPQLLTRIPINHLAKTAGSTATGIIDRMMPSGNYAGWLTVDVIMSTADVVSNKPTVLKLQEAETTDATNFANIAGFIGGTDFTIPNANTAATAVLQNNYKFSLNCRTSRKRYIQAVISPATSQIITIIANLGMGGDSPVTAAKANAMTLVEG